jgi:hypothetical protein
MLAFSYPPYRLPTTSMTDVQQITHQAPHSTHASQQLSSLKIPETVLSQELNGEAVLLNMDNEFYYSLNAIGSKIWQLLNQQMNMEGVIQQLLQIYQVDESTLRQDVAMLIRELCENGLLQRNDCIEQSIQ